MFEYEKKILLSEVEYLIIMLAMSKKLPTVTQTNYYFDTDDFAMNKKGITCRIRRKNDEFKTTIKNHGIGVKDCSIENILEVCDEFHSDAFKQMGLYLQGSLITERMVIHQDKFCKAVLDRNVYLGCTDYELEIEYSYGSDQQAMFLLDKIADVLLSNYCIESFDSFLARIGATKSKSERFFELKQNR